MKITNYLRQQKRYQLSSKTGKKGPLQDRKKSQENN